MEEVKIETIEDRELNNTILKMRSEGISIRGIAEELHISRGQVEHRLRKIKPEFETILQKAEPARVENFIQTIETSIFNTQAKIEEMYRYFEEVKSGVEDTRDKILLLKEFREQVKFAKEFIDSVNPSSIDKMKYANVLSIALLYEELFKEEPETIKNVQEAMTGKTSEELLNVIYAICPDVGTRWKEKLKSTQGGEIKP